ncbi:MAG: hypothetical protein MI807_06590 [Verrucomicrobiales bacterium]|nr:hypothetical protein [Verrucomicrobiales bacterium]
MPSLAQLEAFDWWLDQSREDRTAARLSEIRNIPFDTARKWVTAFNKRLGNEAERRIQNKLNAFVTEFEEVQRISVECGAILVNVYAAEIEKISELAQNGAEIDIQYVGRLASGLRTAYALVERASCADVAKERAKQSETPWMSDGLDQGTPLSCAEWSFPSEDLSEMFNCTIEP